MISYKVALIGLGKMGAGYAEDPAMVRCYACATHAEALRRHRSFDWIGAVDIAPEARRVAQERWQVPEIAERPDELASANDIEVAVIASPPEGRLEIIDAFPNLKAVLVEKPLGATVAAGEKFLEACRQRKVVVAVNLFRRYDEDLAALAAGGLQQRVGKPMAAFVTYGNGLLNNGTHLIDLVHMLLGRTVRVQAISPSTAFVEGPLPGDLNFAFSMELDTGLTVLGAPVQFSAYRENALDIWGTQGRLQLVHEGLTEVLSPVGDNRALTGSHEVRHDEAQARTTSLGSALLRVYDNLAAALSSGEAVKCSGEQGLAAARVVEALFQSVRQGGARIDVVEVPPT